MLRQPVLLIGLALILAALAACTPDNTALNPSLDLPVDVGDFMLEENREEVFLLRNGQPEALALEEPVPLAVGEGAVVEEGGRATLRLADWLTMELLQAGEVKLAELSAGEQATAVTLRQDGGMLWVDFNPEGWRERRLTIQTGPAVVATAKARFVVGQEPDSPLIWIVGLGPAENQLEVTAAGTTRIVSGGSARWVAPGDSPGQDISVDTLHLQAWLNGVRSGASQLSLSEVLLPPANMVGNVAELTALPAPGRPFEVGRNLQGVVRLTLDPVGLFGNPAYALEDCDGDGQQDIAIRAGKVQFDFRSVLARVLALDVTVLNNDQPGQGALWALDPAGDPLDYQPLEVGPGQSQTLSLRSDQSAHYAELALNSGCLMGFSLTPSPETGEPAAPRPAATAQSGDTVVNILEPTREQSSTNRTQIEALPVGGQGYALTLEMDGEADDWAALARQSGLAWTRFETIIYDDACANRYPDSEASTDLAGQVRFAYDERYLYLAFQVEDDGYVGYTGDDERYFLGDSPQVDLDMELLPDYTVASPTQDDLEIQFHPGFENPRLALWSLDTLASRQLEEAQVAAAPTASGYFLEAAVPWSSLNVSPQPGERLGVAVNINDNDTPGTNSQECIISTAPQRVWNDPTTWGALLLRPAD